MIISLAVVYATIAHGPLGSQRHAFAAPVTGLSLPGVSASTSHDEHTALRGAAINKTLRSQPVATTQDAGDALAVASSTPVSQPALAAQEDAVVRAATVPPPPDLPPYTVYEVQDGDTVGAIADRFGVSSKYIVANNAEIAQDSDFLKLGQSIIVPVDDGILHEVRYGETLSDIATRYDVEVDAITTFPANKISTADDITETQLLFVPEGAVEEPAPFPEPEPLPTDPADEDAPTPTPTDGTSDDTSDSDSAPAADDEPEEPASDAAESGAGLIWPVVGPISSYYGPSHPLGIDIDGFNLGGAAIAASTSGTVVFAGGNACCSYGLYVVIMSPSGIETLYAHLSSISVVQGETVSQGETIGVIGSTGYSTGTHLHFEVIDNGARQNPLAYLP